MSRRFLLQSRCGTWPPDEAVQLAVAEQMRQRGIDAVHVRELNLRGDADRTPWQRASEMGRVVCTFDYDFIRLHRQGIPHAGIIIARHSSTTIGDRVRDHELICGVLPADEMKNRIEYL